MADVAVEQYPLDGGEGTETIDMTNIATVDVLLNNGIAALVSQKEVRNSHGVNKNGDVDITDILKFDDASDTSLDETTNGKNEILHEESDEERHAEETVESSSGVVGEVVEEEIVELEFEKVKPKLDTHSMHCPNCKAEVTKVILRRKVLSYRPVVQKPVVVPAVKPAQSDDPKELVGCFSCLSLFTYSDNGSFNPFDIFRKRPDTAEEVPTSSSGGVENAKLVVREKDNCLSMFWVFGKGQKDVKPNAPSQPDHAVLEQNREVIIPDQAVLEQNREVIIPDRAVLEQNREVIFPDQVQPIYGTGTASIAQGKLPSSSDAQGDGSTETAASNNGGAKKGILGAFRLPSSELPPSSNAEGDADIMIEVETEPEIAGTGRLRVGYEVVFAEILKSVVYGGLMEVIASLSVVASAAASNAGTLSIVALALASLVGGALVVGHNLWDLRDDCHKGISNEVTNSEATNKYKELLGRVEYFPLHAFFAILSFLVFGMIPPVAYGYSFHETNDKDYTLVVVSVASLLCVSLLAIFKAYINKCTVLGYFKTVVYYITTAVSVSGVSYVAGNLVTRLMEEYGLFDTGSGGGGVSLLPHATISSLASF